MSKSTDMGEMLTIREVCRFFGGDGTPLHKSTIYHWIANGKLAPPVRMGVRLRRWRRADCQKLLDQMAGKP